VSATPASPAATAAFPFSALVGCDDLATALLLSAVDPGIGGVLVRGEKGTAKSTAVRALAGLLPPVAVVEGCRFACDPRQPDPACPDGPHSVDAGATTRPARLIELPVGASEDRVAGSLDLQQALTHGARAFEPGLLAAAHRGVLYVDEVNLLGDHVVDLLLDAAAMGRAVVEREGVSVSHAARFQLIGTMNPEEGELRPQLLDRFGLSAAVVASREPGERAEVVRRRLAFDADPAGFAARYADDDAALATRLADARARVGDVALGERALEAIVAACTAFEVDGLRADLVTAKAAAARAAWRGGAQVTIDDVHAAARLALPHRRRRGPFEAPGLDDAELDAVLEPFRDEPFDPPPDGDGPSEQGSVDGSDDAGGQGGHGEASSQELAGSERSQADDGDTPGDAPSGVSPAHDANASPATEPAGAGADAGVEPHPGADAGNACHGAGPPAGDAGPEGGDAAGTVTLPAGDPFAPVRLELATTGRGARGRRSPSQARHGASVGARPVGGGRRLGAVGDVAVAATVRAAAPYQGARGHTGPGLALAPDDLHHHVREGREGNLVVFAVDASGSMAARKRMTAVKGAAHSLLTDAYQRRDRVAVVAFRDAGAEVSVPPTTSVELAAARLAALPTGGRTPLAAGLERAGTLIATEAVRDPSRRALLVVLTDGRATRARAHPDGQVGDPVDDALEAAGALAARGVAAIVVDTEDAPVRLGLATRLAATLKATPVRLEQLAAGELAGVVRAATTAPTPRAA
jgi:magnesium chelatase subunit D